MLLIKFENIVFKVNLLLFINRVELLKFIFIFFLFMFFLVRMLFNILCRLILYVGNFCVLLFFCNSKMLLIMFFKWEEILWIFLVKLFVICFLWGNFRVILFKFMSFVIGVFNLWVILEVSFCFCIYRLWLFFINWLILLVIGISFFGNVLIDILSWLEFKLILLSCLLKLFIGFKLL